MNTANILKLADHLDALPPERFDMRNWCGTACCVCGHIGVLNGFRNNQNGHDHDGNRVPGIDYGSAADWLGIEAGIAIDELFIPGLDGNAAFLDAGGYADLRPHQAAAVLRHLAETGEVDWSVAVGAKPRPRLPRSITGLLEPGAAVEAA